MKRHLVVGYHSSKSSHTALRWAIRHARLTDSRLTIVHASSSPVTVVNGPSVAIAHKLGNPDWAVVHGLVQGLDAPSDTTTIVEPGSAAAVLARHCGDADAIVLGPARRRLFSRTDTQRSLQGLVGLPVIRVDDGWLDELLPEREHEAQRPQHAMS